MTRHEFLDLINRHYPQSINPDYDGCCPCSSWEEIIDGKVFGFATRCWRVSEYDQDLYVWGDVENIEQLAIILKRKMDEQEWYNEYTIIYLIEPLR
jgi:hypothetical protein